MASWREDLLALDPGLAAAVDRVAITPDSQAELDVRLRSLIRVGVDLVVTHLFPGTVGIHMGAALAAGASVGELLGVLQIACSVTADAYPAALAVVLDEAGLSAEAFGGGDAARASSFRDGLRESGAGLDPAWDAALRATPGYTEALLSVSHRAFGSETLDPRRAALIGLALAGAPPVRDLEAVRRYARAALDAGATPAQAVQALQFAAGVGLHAFTVGVPALTTALAARTPG